MFAAPCMGEMREISADSRADNFDLNAYDDEPFDALEGSGNVWTSTTGDSSPYLTLTTTESRPVTIDVVFLVKNVENVRVTVRAVSSETPETKLVSIGYKESLLMNLG